MAASVSLPDFSDPADITPEQLNEVFQGLVAAVNSLAGSEIITYGTPVNPDPTYVPRAGGRFDGEVIAPSILIGASGQPLHPVVTTKDKASTNAEGITRIASEVANVSESVSSPPTQAEVEVIAQKVNELLAALRAAGLVKS